MIQTITKTEIPRTRGMPQSKQQKGQGLATETHENVTVKELLESGAHFGHQKHRWNPKMRRFIFEERSGIYIIDLAKTVQQIRLAIDFVKQVVASHKSILFVGTKKQAKGAVQESAIECGEFYVAERWLGGMITNLPTIRKSVKSLELLEKQLASSDGSFTKKELTIMSKRREKLERNLSGIRDMRKYPGLVIVVDPSKEHIAVAEAKKLGIPVMALVDTNCDPDPIDYVIACNDDALKSIKLILSALTQAIVSKKAEMKVSIASKEEESKAPEVEVESGGKDE